MAPSVEFMKNILGKTALLGPESLDLWELKVNQRSLNQELKKMSADEKQLLAQQLLKEAESEKEGKPQNEYQDQDFDNPFNTCPPATLEKDGAGLVPNEYRELTLKEKNKLTENFNSYRFTLAQEEEHINCLAGQYIQVRIPAHSGYPEQERYFSPVSCPEDRGHVDLVVRQENEGLMTTYFKNMSIGDSVGFRGPMGGFEYKPNTLPGILLLCSGGGVTPAIQIIRSITRDKHDSTDVTLLYYVDNEKELLFFHELKEYEREDSRLKIVFSIGETPEEWDGEEGHIDSNMMKRHTSDQDRMKKVVICGGPTMVVSVLFILKDLCFPSDKIFVFGPFGVEQVRRIYGRNAKLSSHRSDE